MRRGIILLALHVLALCSQLGVALSTLNHQRPMIPTSRGSESNSQHRPSKQHTTLDSEETITSQCHFIQQTTISRRKWLSSLSVGTILLSQQQVANAAPPLTAEVADNFQARLERSLRPKPAKVLRPRMNLDFAVLLMRSSYNAVDQIDIVAMVRFMYTYGIHSFISLLHHIIPNYFLCVTGTISTRFLSNTSS